MEFNLTKWDPYKYFKKSKNNIVAIVGPRRSGKSELIKFLYTKIWKKQFDLTIVFSKNPITIDFYNEFIISADGKGKLIRNEEFNPAIMDIIKQTQNNRLRENKKMLNILMILDDATDRKLRTTQEFSDIFFYGRHLNIQLVYATQSATSLTSSQRENIDLLIIFRLNIRMDKDIIFKEFLHIDYDELPEDYKNYPYRYLDKMNTVVCMDHNCMVIDYKEPTLMFKDNVKKFKAPMYKK